MLTLIEKILVLQNVEIFGEVTTEQLSFLAAIASELALAPGQIIYKENEAPDGLYVVVSGSVRVLRGGAEIFRVGSNQALGVWTLFDNEPRMVTTETAEESVLLYISRDDFFDVLADHVDLMAGLFRQLIQRLRKLAITMDPKSWRAF